MTTTSYTDNSIFESAQLNAICDFIFTKLVEAFPPGSGDPTNNFVYRGVILSGRAAAILQGATSADINNVIFQVSNPDIISYLRNNLVSLFNCKQVDFKERILFYPLDNHFEIWITDSLDMHPREESRIQVQTDTYIPTQTL
jgi:hypothetical protein